LDEERELNPTPRRREDGSAASRVPELSVVVVSYECRQHLIDVLDDLRPLRDALSLEVLVVDNASSDGSPQAVRALHPWVTLDALHENLGFGRANNLAIRRARARLVLLLNPDTRVTAPAIRGCIEELKAHPEVGILSPRVIDGNGDFDRRSIRGFPTLWGVFCHVSRLDRILRDPWSRRYTLGLPSGDHPMEVEAVSGAVMFARTDALREIGGFDERFFMYGEDIDLCLRMRASGWRVRFWSGVTITHLGGRSGMTSRSADAWARSIGDLHRLHRPGRAGRVTGALCDVAGTALNWLRHAQGGRSPAATPPGR
jgi:GT2 family glycosyltransferase